MEDDWHDRLPFPQSLNADDPQTYLTITKMREAAEAEHGKETIAQATKEYVSIRAELSSRPLDPNRKRDLQKRTAFLEHQYSYEVLTGAPRITGGNHPVHAWPGQLEGAPDEPPTS